MIQNPVPGMVVGVVSDSTGHGLNLGSLVILKERHPEHSDAWLVEGSDSFVRTCDIESLTSFYDQVPPSA
jgi:hypothetical protein